MDWWFLKWLGLALLALIVGAAVWGNPIAAIKGMWDLWKGKGE